MPNFRTITVPKAVANNGVQIVGFDGDGSLTGPSAIVIFASNSQTLPPNDPTISIQLFPSGHTANGTDSNGNISVTATLVDAGDDQNFAIAGGGNYFKAAGLWSDQIRAVLTCIGDPSVEFDLQYSGSGFIDFDNSTPPTPPTPTNVQITNITNPDPQLPTKMDVTIQYNNPDHVNFPNVHAMFMRTTDNAPFNTAVMVGTTPVVPVGNQTFIDVPDNGHSYTYYVFLYDPSNMHITATPGVTSSVMTADPGGIYQLVLGKTHDTLYNSHGTPTTNNFAIPNPFIKTGFIDG